MSSSPKIKNLQLTSDQKLLAGLQANLSSLPPLFLAGQMVTPAESVAVVQGRVDRGAAVVSARGIYQSSVQANRDGLTQTETFISQLKAALEIGLANAPDKMAEYGIVPKKKTGPRTVLDKVVAQAKAKSTREARHTMGSRAKEKVKGGVGSTLTIVVGNAGGAVVAAEAAVGAEAGGAHGPSAS